MGELPVDRFTGTLVEISVAGFRQAALEQELRARAPVLRRELDIQRAAVEAIASTMKADFEIVLAQREQMDVVEPYRQGGRLARIWTDRRRELLAATAGLGAVDAAARSAAGLQASFDALLRNQLGAAEIASLLADVNQILTLIETVRGLRSAPGA